jgi:transcriptional regulator with XRE-family HTH domain
MAISLFERRRLRLRMRMRQEKLTAIEVASIVGVQPQTVRLYMCGLRRIPAQNYTKFVEYLDSRSAAA